MLALEGKQLGNYDVIRRIRVGGMGAVYEGKQRTAFDRRVAIKVILGNYATDRDMRRRFAREARTIARLHHPHILPLIEYGDEQGLLYLVMPFIEGGTLTSYLRRSLPDLNEVSAIYQQLLDDDRLAGLLAENGLFILGHAKRDTLTVPALWIEKKLLKHGDSIMRFFAPMKQQALPRAA